MLSFLKRILRNLFSTIFFLFIISCSKENIPLVSKEVAFEFQHTINCQPWINGNGLIHYDDQTMAISNYPDLSGLNINEIRIDSIIVDFLTPDGDMENPKKIYETSGQVIICTAIPVNQTRKCFAPWLKKMGGASVKQFHDLLSEKALLDQSGIHSLEESLMDYNELTVGVFFEFYPSDAGFPIESFDVRFRIYTKLFTTE